MAAGQDEGRPDPRDGRAVSAIPGMEPSFSQPIRDNVLESISQVDGQIVIKVFGDDLDALHEEARRILGEISGVPGVARAFIDREGRCRNTSSTSTARRRRATA